MILLGRLSLYGQGAERLHEELVPVAARWTEPSKRQGPLKAYARETELRTLDLLEAALTGEGMRVPNETVRARLLETALQDIEELLPQLEPRANELVRIAVERLAERGTREERDLREILERQRTRVIEELARYDREFGQLTLGFDAEERRQVLTNVRSWRRRLEQFDRDLAEEPARIRRFYEVRATRVEPVGLAYLWPETN